MSCYGIPSSILNVKEYGGSTQVVGPLKDLDVASYYKTFTYKKRSLSLKGDSGTNGYFIKTAWASDFTTGSTRVGSFGSNPYEYDHPDFAGSWGNLQKGFAKNLRAKTVEFRIKPHRLETNQHLWSLSGSNAGAANQETYDEHLILEPYIGNDISSSGDSTDYGRITWSRNNHTELISTKYFPIFNGDFWNLFVQTESSGSTATKTHTTFGAYQANFNKNVTSIVTSSKFYEEPASTIALAWGLFPVLGPVISNATGRRGAAFCYIGGLPAGQNNTAITGLRYSGSLQEVRYHFGEKLSHTTLTKHALEPFMYSGDHVSSSYENLILRLPLGSNDQQDSSSFHPRIEIDYLGDVSSNMTTQEWEEINEDHYLPTPDTVGRSWTSEKVRIDDGVVDENILSLTTNVETSTLDRQPLDYPDLGIFFSPTTEINEDILYTLGSFRLDDYIGSPLPSAQTASVYNDLKTVKNAYYQKVERKYNYYEYIKLIQQIDHTLFKMIEQFVPLKANVKTGLLIEPTFLERNKIERTLPVRSDAQTMTTGLHQTFEAQIKTKHKNNRIYTVASSSNPNTQEGKHDPGSHVVGHNNFSSTTNSRGLRKEKGTNATIDLWNNHLSPFIRDKNSENNQSCQAPIKPYFAGSGVGAAIIGGVGVEASFVIGSEYTSSLGSFSKPENYVAHKSSEFLGTAVNAKKSNKYYKYKDYFLT